MADSAPNQPIPLQPNFSDLSLFPPITPATDSLQPLLQPVSSDGSWKSKLFDPLNPASDRALVFLEPVVDGEKQIASCRRSEIELIAKDWEGKLLGFLLGKKQPHLPSLKKIMVSKWGLKGPLELSFHGNGAFLLKFSSDEEKTSVLETGPWFFSGRLLVLKPWRRHLKISDFDTANVPIWVRLPYLPVEFWSKDSLSRIGSLLGRPHFFDEMTASRARSSFARICLEVSASKAFPNEIYIDIEGTEGFSQVVKAEWMPVRCPTCKEFFHESRPCPLKLKSASIISTLQSDPRITSAQSDPRNTTVHGDGSWTVVQGRKYNRKSQYVQRSIPETDLNQFSMARIHESQLGNPPIQTEEAHKSQGNSEASHERHDFSLIQSETDVHASPEAVAGDLGKKSGNSGGNPSTCDSSAGNVFDSNTPISLNTHTYFAEIRVLDGDKVVSAESVGSDIPGADSALSVAADQLVVGAEKDRVVVSFDKVGGDFNGAQAAISNGSSEICLGADKDIGICDKASLSSSRVDPVTDVEQQPFSSNDHPGPFNASKPFNACLEPLDPFQTESTLTCLDSPLALAFPINNTSFSFTQSSIPPSRTQTESLNPLFIPTNPPRHQSSWDQGVHAIQNPLAWLLQ